ncbi:MAG: flagellar hook-length control protein FliK [Treponema sp.]|nr:flagellar hook-length control protein FliK [Treponema sp.]
MELTEILVAVKQPDFQKTTTFSEPVRETPRNGKSFSELLAGISSENQDSVKENVADTSEKNYKNDEKVSDSKKSEDGKTSEKVQTKGKPEEKSEKKVAENTKKDEKTEKGQIYSYSALNLIKEENMSANFKGLEENQGMEIGEITNNLLDKIASRDDGERVKILSNGVKLEVSDDFDFEVVTDEALALESAQTKSVENPLDFLSSYEHSEENSEFIQNYNQADVKEETPFDKLKSKINVTDLRSDKSPEEKINSDIAEPKMKVTMTGNDSATVELNLAAAQNQVSGDVLANNIQIASSDGSTFQAMLNNQIQANAAEIVQTGNIILKDNNKGTINLVLHPDDIGNVKIQLSLDGDKITGHIAVNTKEALEVFKNNAESLREAFMKNGYENASFEVSYNSSGNNASQQFAEQNQQNQNSFFAKREYGLLDLAAGNFDSENKSEEFSEITKFGINIVA